MLSCGDITEWGFEDASSNSSASGDFTDGTGVAAFLPNTSWYSDGVEYAFGSQSVTQEYPVTGGNTGVAFYYRLDLYGGGKRTDTYVRWYYRHSSICDLTDWWKGLRFKGNSGTGEAPVGGFMGTLNFSTQHSWFMDNVESCRIYANENTPMPSCDSLKGTWRCYEVHLNFASSVLYNLEIWMDGTRYFNKSLNTSGLDSSYKYYEIQFNGTINSNDGAGASDTQAWFDQVGIGTSYMGPAS
jgi:hypothetical protein